MTAINSLGECEPPSVNSLESDPRGSAAAPGEAAGPVREIAAAARDAARALRTEVASRKNEALFAIAEALVINEVAILAANERDVERERAGGMSPGLIDRLTLTSGRIESIAQAVREVAGLPDPVGEVVRGSTLPNGLKLRQVRVPMGVVGMIYEARPNVTVDAAALTLKSGNAVILRGGSAAASTNEVIVRVIGEALAEVGLPTTLVQSIDAYGREGAVALMHARGLVDVLVPRGGASLIETVVRESTVPVIETGVGNCHVYVDAAADLAMARRIVMNSKTHRVGVCNAMETLLVHREVAAEFVAAIAADLSSSDVTLHGDDEVRDILGDRPEVVEATEDDWGREYLSLDLAVKVVESLEEAVQHIAAYGSGHTEAIVSSDIGAVHRFQNSVDAAAVIANASTRFTDGGQFGLGAEIGISTQKLHARGPMGLMDLTTTTWLVEGDGQVRE